MQHKNSFESSIAIHYIDLYDIINIIGDLHLFVMEELEYAFCDYHKTKMINQKQNDLLKYYSNLPIK